MKNLNYILALSGVLVATGCGNSTKNEPVSAAQQKAKELKVEAGETRQAYETAMDKEIEALQSDIAALEKKRDEQNVAELRDAATLRLEDAREQFDKLEEKYTEFKKNAADDWKARRESLNKLYESSRVYVKTSLERADDEAKIQANLDKLAARIATMKTEIASASDEAKAKLQEDLKKLEAKNEDLKAKFKELRNSSNEKWETLKDGFSNAFEDLSKAFKDIFK